MIYNNFLNRNYIFISLFLVMVMNVSVVMAEDSIVSNTDTAQSETMEQENVYEELEPVLDENEEGAIEEFELSIEGMASEQDEIRVKEALWNCKGVEGVKVSHEESNAQIQIYVDEADYNEIITAVQKAGFAVVETE
jgi:copper chaperone CopZ